jgi:hypothetical protein
VSDRISIDLLAKRITELQDENERSRVNLGGDGLKSDGGSGTLGAMDLTTYRLDQFEKRADAADARMARVEDKLTTIQVTLAGLATKDAIRNWGLTVVAIVLATGIGLGAVLLQSSNNQLAAFQAGLSTIQAITAAAQAGQHDTSAPLSAPAPQRH